MRTDDLIRAMAADADRRSVPMASAWAIAIAIAAAMAAVVFFATLGTRPDIAHAVETVRFLFKFVVTIALSASAFVLLRMLSCPGGNVRAAAPWLAAGPLLLAGAVIAELFAVPSAQWTDRLIGTNSMVCLTYIPLIGIGPLAVFLSVLRHGAPPRPRLAGAVAGILAGGLAATFYAAQCTDDSPLFVATWYTIAIAGLALLGALVAPRIVRW